jgi:hypothetical protein
MVFTQQAETCADSIASTQPAVRLARKHHLLVRVSHWLNVLLLAGLMVSGISIYWASPIYQHSPDPQTGNSDYFADAGVWLCAHIPGLPRERRDSNPGT